MQNVSTGRYQQGPNERMQNDLWTISAAIKIKHVNCKILGKPGSKKSCHTAAF